MKYALLILIFSVSSQVLAFEPCDDPQALQSLWSTKYSLLVSEPSPLISKNADLNKPENFKLKKLAQAFCFIDKAGTPTNFYQYIMYLIKNNIFNSFAIAPDSNTPSKADTMADYSAKKILILPSFYTNTNSYYDYKRASLLLHEARHFEIDTRNREKPSLALFNGHVLCNHGDLVNEYACDQRFSGDLPDAGPCSYEVVFYRELFDYSPYNVNKKDLAFWITHTLKNTFNYVSPTDFKNYTASLTSNAKLLSHRN